LKYMLDTDTCIFLMTGRSPALTERILERPASDYVMSAVTAAELHFGAGRSDRPREAMERVRALCSEVAVAAFDEAAAASAGAIRAALVREGKPIGPYDVLIGGHALALKVTLVTGNLREFRRIKGLHAESWG
jgi:tRNA(fMet)-specific endonuclease VapC